MKEKEDKKQGVEKRKTKKYNTGFQIQSKKSADGRGEGGREG